MKANPLVSIIIPVYNGSDYVAEAINSALAQTYPNIEIIVVNDGSNDGGRSEAIALSYGDKIRYISKPNGGVSSALNLGISVMTGDYFSWLSHDDKYMEKKVESQVDLLRKYEGQRVIALCGSQFIDKNSELISHKEEERFTSEYVDWVYALTDLFKKGTYCGCAFLIPKECFNECELFDEQLRFCQDTLMWAKLLLSKCAIVYDRTTGVLSRVHGNQQTHKSRHLLAHDSEKIAKYLVPQLVKEEQHQALYFFAKRNAMQNNHAAVQVCVKGGSLTGAQRAKLLLYSGYGKIRPAMRKIYYAVFRRVNIS